MALMALMAALSERYSWKKRTMLPKIESAKMIRKHAATAATGFSGSHWTILLALPQASPQYHFIGARETFTGPCRVEIMRVTAPVGVSASRGERLSPSSSPDRAAME